MTCRAVGRRVDVVQLAQRGAVNFWVTRSLPVHIGCLGGRSKIGFGMAVTIQTEAHAQSLLLANDGHLVDSTVTRHASHSPSYVGAVVEIHVIRKVVDFYPFDGLPSRCTLPDREQLGAVRVDEGMAVHTRRGGRDGRVARLVDCVVTVLTVNSEFTRMERVTVGNWLLGLVSDICRFRRHAVPDQGCQVDGGTAQGDTHDLPGFVGPAWEDEQLHRYGKPGGGPPPRTLAGKK